MNKSDLIDIMEQKTKKPHKVCEDFVNLVFNMMAKKLAHDGRIEIRGFGSFVNREYESYKGRNPRTGEAITVAPKKLPYFKVGKELKKRVDEGVAQQHFNYKLKAS